MSVVPGGYWVRRAGWVYRVGNTGTYRPAICPRAEVPTASQRPQGAGPALQGQGGLDAGGDRPLRVTRYPGTSGDHPAGSGRYSPAPGRGLPVTSSSSGKGRDSTSFLIKLVKTAKCHQKVSKRPTLVPDFQNGSRKSPLDFLGNTFSPAFSHKELMGLFGPRDRL